MSLRIKLILKVIINCWRPLLIYISTNILVSLILFFLIEGRNGDIGMYEGTKFDYILSACSCSQVSEYKKLNFIENIVEWKSISGTEIENNNTNKKIGEVGVIILECDNSNVGETI